MDIQIDDFDDFKMCLEKLIKLNLIEHIEHDAAVGIAKFVIENGTENLSNKQEYVFKKYVLDKFFDRKCSSCGEQIPWCEMPAIIEDTKKICGACLHNSEKKDQIYRGYSKPYLGGCVLWNLILLQ